MGCKDIREILETCDELPSGVREHVAGCPACQAHASGLAVLRQGLHLLNQDPVPEPSVGFRVRVLRRLEERAGRDFLEYAGRRVVYATLVLVLVLLLAMIVPSSGPVRRAPSLETSWPQAESVTAGNYTIPMDGVSPAPVLVDMKTGGPGGH